MSSKQGTWGEFIWEFRRASRRICPILPGIKILEAQFQRLIAACLEAETSATRDLIGLTLAK